jgi:NitT/TauT family transport system substrate-binding protein
MPIKLAENFRAVFYAPFYAAHALGLFANEGVEVELVSSSAPGDGVSALLDGSIDITWAGPMRVMKAQDLQVPSPFVCFCEVVGRDPFYLVGGRHLPEFRLADLPAVRFAAVSEVPTPWMCLQQDLREHGVDPSRLDRAANRSMADNLAALASSALDVAQLFEPYASMALQSHVGRILYAAAARGPTLYTTFIATRTAVERQRDEFSAMTRAMRHMQDWLSRHEAEEFSEIVAPFFPDIARNILANSLQRYRQAGIWVSTPKTARQGFTRLGASLLSGGFISRTPIYEECIDESLQ